VDPPILRPAAPAEFDQAAALIVAAYEQYRPAMPAEAWEEYRNDMADVRGRAASAELLVLEQAGALVGCVTYYPTASGAWPPGGAYFRLLAVAPAARGTGAGRTLTESCVARARSEGRVYLGLHTTALMTVARAMYERMGFQRYQAADFHPAPQFTVMAYRLTL
jgi:ribosomal protein S18 acetylase RimI-like enzyme